MSDPNTQEMYDAHRRVEEVAGDCYNQEEKSMNDRINQEFEEERTLALQTQAEHEDNSFDHIDADEAMRESECMDWDGGMYDYDTE